MTEYTEKNRPMNQKEIIDGVCINPTLREDFDSTSNSSRPDLETADWWGRAYILANKFSPADDTYKEYVERIKGYRKEYAEIIEGYRGGPDLIDRKQWEMDFEDSKSSFEKEFPTGIAYTVRILDGGAWDRSTWKADLSNLDEAIQLAKALSF